ncbi:OPT oligopeptide transporter protein-domain-containing protein [Gymnopilus junonius]|uniref:OPT oligopeptide transporter protein-domain-containing protein n=1 Tax=Gymnopilus junonius TaxID=109634 RepID=A0A9P5TLG8_GYMJU|nr:OPT oligopeptide transporter protein-domain-containing protein [Gymnopilus junonius]
MSTFTEKEDLKDASIIAESVKDERLSDDSSDNSSQDFVDEKDLERPEAVAIQVISTRDDHELPVMTFRAMFLGLGLSAFSSVLATIYTFKPQNASVSQLFCLIIAYILGIGMAALPRHGLWRYVNPGPFNIKEHTVIVIMSSTASSVATAMEIIAALDLFYDIHLNSAAAVFSIFATQMLGYGMAGLLRTLLVYPTYAFYPGYISVVNLLQSLHFRGALNSKKRRFFWIVFTAIFFWEWIPQYAFPLLTAISVICLADNGRHDFVRNLFGAGSSNEGIGLLSFSTKLGMALGYLLLTGGYYLNVFHGRDIAFMSTALFGSDGNSYNQTAVIGPDFKLNPDALATIGLPRYTTTYALSQLFYNLSLGSAFTYILIWHWPELKAAFGGLRFLKRGHADVDDPHYKEMQKYPEVPQWAYGLLFIVSLAVGIGCSYAGPHGTVLIPAWSIIFFTILSALIAVVLGFSKASFRFSISIKYAIQIIAAFLHPGKPIPVMYANLFGNSTSFQTLYLLQDLKLGQYTKVPPRMTFFAQMAGSIIGSVFNYTMMQIIVTNNREVLKDPIGTRVWSGWIVQQYNSASVAMGALGKSYSPLANLRAIGSFLLQCTLFMGLFVPLPFWLIWRWSNPDSRLAKAMKYINVPIITLYIGFLPYSVNGQWWSCLVIGVFSQRPRWFVKYNYLMSAALDGGSQVILFVLSFAVFGASGSAVAFPTWWGNPATLSVDRCKST